eukprot:UN08111
MDDILLFLVIIYGKEKYPEEENALISKLKQFVISSAFTNIKNFLHSKHFPLLQHEFISNNNYFASMIEAYGSELAQTLPESTCIEDYIYNKIQDKITDLFNDKFKELECKINNLSKEIHSIKSAMIEDVKQDMNVEDIMDDIKLIKKEMNKFMRKPIKKPNRKSNSDGLRKWVKNECGLPQYEDVFIENG